jgi:hypothetical protein
VFEKGKKGEKGKGKKSGKAGKNRDVELQMAVANAQLWASRLEVTEKSRNEFRETCKTIAGENEKLQSTLFQSERDTVEVVTYLKKGDMEKDEKITQLEQDVNDIRKQNRKDKESLIGEFTKQIQDLEKTLELRTDEVKLMQSELKLVKEFRRKRALMQSELDEIRESLFNANKEHKDSLQKMEHKFFEEKIRLEREASQKIAELAERAHTEAIAKLDETTRSVYKENIRLNEALSYHIQESEELGKKCELLTDEVEDLRAEKALNEATVKEKVTESKRNKKEIHDLKIKVEQLEAALSTMVRQFHVEKKSIEDKAHMMTVAGEDEIYKLQRILQIKDKETNRIKKIAKNIIEQRTTLEVFFHESLEKVRTEIAVNRAQYIQAAKSAYQQKMIAAHAGTAEFPKVRNFKKNDKSTNSVFDDLSEAEHWKSLGNQVDIRDLTWEQKEKVLRLLFARMNGVKSTSRVNAPPMPVPPQSTLSITNHPVAGQLAKSSPVQATKSEDPPQAPGPSAFLTQQEVAPETQELSPGVVSLPLIHQTKQQV